jgi:hypothetical protein
MYVTGGGGGQKKATKGRNERGVLDASGKCNNNSWEEKRWWVVVTAGNLGWFMKTGDTSVREQDGR